MGKSIHIHSKGPRTRAQIEQQFINLGLELLRSIRRNNAFPTRSLDMLVTQKQAPSAPSMPGIGNMDEVKSNHKEMVLYSFNVSYIQIDSHYVALYGDAI